MNSWPDLVLVDSGLPDMDGVEICRRLRGLPEFAATPIIVLQPVPDERRAVACFAVGANDCIALPVSDKLLVARIHVQFHRPGERSIPPIRYEGLALAAGTRHVTLNGRPIGPFTPFEHAMLVLLTAHPGQTYSRRQIIAAVHGGGFVTARTIDVRIAGIRRKLGPWATHLETIRKVGYRIS